MQDGISQIEEARRLLPLSEATYLILLALHEPRHGYGIMQAVAAADGSGVRLGPGTLYGALNNLQKQGLIERAETNGADPERRKVYALTSLGRATVELECARHETMAQIGRRLLGRAGESDEQA